MPEDNSATSVPERVARIEEHIEMQNGLLRDSLKEAKEMRKDIQDLSKSISFFKGVYTVGLGIWSAGIAFAIAWWKGRA